MQYFTQNLLCIKFIILGKVLVFLKLFGTKKKKNECDNGKKMMLVGCRCKLNNSQ